MFLLTFFILAKILSIILDDLIHFETADRNLCKISRNFKLPH